MGGGEEDGRRKRRKTRVGEDESQDGSPESNTARGAELKLQVRFRGTSRVVSCGAVFRVYFTASQGVARSCG